MRRLLTVLVALSLAPVSASAAGRLGFEYTIEMEKDGAVKEASFLKGFETREGLRLRVKLEQASYCYMIAGDGQERFYLTFPDPQSMSNAPFLQARAKLPRMTFMRLDEDSSIERLFLVVSAEKVPELEAVLRDKRKAMRESEAIEIRDRYQGEGSYRREILGDVAKVRWTPRGTRPAVVVEEIAIRRSAR
jgi:hypothetical protein